MQQQRITRWMMPNARPQESFVCPTCGRAGTWDTFQKRAGERNAFRRSIHTQPGTRGGLTGCAAAVRSGGFV
jgi:hypothetical protein